MTAAPSAAGAVPGAAPPSDRPPREGDVLDGRYRLVALLGRGGFGDVWRADELLPDGAPFRQVALKLLAPHVTDAASWVEEAKLLASFRHPSLVTIFATGVFHGAWPQPFVAMELLEGDNLADVLTERGPVPWRRALAWAREAAAALDVIHERGVVHLDLKPANLFLCKDGTLKVLDFGIARRATTPPARVRGEGDAPAAPPRFSPSKEPAAAAVTGAAPPSSPPRSQALSQRDAEMATAAFMVEQALDVSAAPAVAQATPEAFAPTFAMEGGADVYGKTHHVGSTTARAIIGTPGYMAPEIFEQIEPSAATDAYALAVCVAVLVTGKLPLDVPDEPEGGWANATAVTAWWAAIRAATLRGQMRDLRASTRLPDGLARLLRKLCSVDAAARGVVPGALRAALDEVWERPHGVPDPPFCAGALTIEHEGCLFGRDEEIARLGRDLEHEPCVVLVGPDAAGKTSLALAGLVPHLGKRATDGKDDYRALVLRDPDRGDEALDDALEAASPELRGASVDTLAAFCERADVGLAVVVDPLEAVMKAPAEGRARIEELLALAGDGRARPGLRVIASLGEERAAEVQATAFGRALRASMRYVGPPAPQAASALVTGPLRLARAEVTGLEAVIADVQREIAAPGRLAFVAQALLDFWGTRERDARDRILLHAQRWRDQRGVVGAVARAADRALDAMVASDRALAEEVLLFFTATDGTTVKWSRADLFDAFDRDRAAAERVVDRLVAAGLLRANEQALELLHEGLLDGWRRLRSLRDAHLVRLAFVERLRESAHAWEKSAKGSDMLLRGFLLADVKAHPGWMECGLVPRERELVAESLRAERRRRVARAASMAAAALAVVLLFFGKRAVDRQRDEARRAEEAALEQARLSELIAHARRTDDPFRRVALMAEAIRRGSEDGLLPVELADAVADVPRARFLTLDPVVAPTFPWDDRWLVAGQTSTTLLIADLRPPEPDVIEDLDLDVDPDKVKRKAFLTPKVHLLRPFEEPIAEHVPFAFDTTFAARSAAGEVRLFRLTEEGDVKLAAIAPVKCSGALRTAARAPVLACANEEGLVTWDARRTGAGAVSRHAWKGSVADVSPDGSVVVGMAERALFLWKPTGGRTLEIGMNEPILTARVSPRDGAVAVVTTSAVEVYDIDDAADPLVRVEHFRARINPMSARWDEGGLDLALCGRDGRSAWISLRGGARPPSEPAPAGSPCAAAVGKRIPARVARTEDLGEFIDLVLGSRPAFDSFRLPDGRLMTRELVLFDEPKRAARALLWFRGRTDAGVEEVAVPGQSVASVLRDGDSVVWQVGGELRAYEAATGKRRLTRTANLLRACEDGRLAAWTKNDKVYRVLDARTDKTLGEIPREPMLVLGVDARCTTLYTQSLDGAILARPLAAGAPPRTIATADGYVYDVRPSAARGPEGEGLYLLVSSGAIARIDGATGAVRVLTYATPRASAVADGPGPGEILFSDATGVRVLRASGTIDRISETDAELAVTDVAASPDGRAVLFLAGPRLHVLDVVRGERRVMPVKNRERILTWDPEGSVLLWSADRSSLAEGTIVPRAKALAVRVAQATSNLEVTPQGEATIRR